MAGEFSSIYFVRLLSPNITFTNAFQLSFYGYHPLVLPYGQTPPPTPCFHLRDGLRGDPVEVVQMSAAPK